MSTPRKSKSTKSRTPRKAKSDKPLDADKFIISVECNGGEVFSVETTDPVAAIHENAPQNFTIKTEVVFRLETANGQIAERVIKPFAARRIFINRMAALILVKNLKTLSGISSADQAAEAKTTENTTATTPTDLSNDPNVPAEPTPLKPDFNEPIPAKPGYEGDGPAAAVNPAL